jgi:hypothetical protein
MSFYIYENWQAGPHKAVIHLNTCGFCNDGSGVAGGYDPRHAKWHGPFQTIQQAQSTATLLRGVVDCRKHRCTNC